MKLNVQKTYDEAVDLEEHMLSGIHTYAEKMFSIDKVRQLFVEKNEVNIATTLTCIINNSSKSRYG